MFALTVQNQGPPWQELTIVAGSSVYDGSAQRSSGPYLSLVMLLQNLPAVITQLKN